MGLKLTLALFIGDCDKQGCYVDRYVENALSEHLVLSLKGNIYVSKMACLYYIEMGSYLLI